MADLTAAQQAQIIAQLRARADAARKAVAALGDGESQRNALNALASSGREITALEGSAERRLGQDYPIGNYQTGPDAWLHDCRELESTLAALPGDAQQGTIEDVLKQTAKATTETVAKIPGQVLDAAGNVAGWGVSALWGGLPWWAKGGLLVGGLGAVAFVGWRAYQWAQLTAPPSRAA